MHPRRTHPPQGRALRVRNRVRFSQDLRSIHPVPAACGHAALRPQRLADCAAHGKHADAPCAPLWRTEPSNPGTNWKLVPGGHTGRPYEEAEGGSVGADFISARCPRVGCTFAERTPLRRTEPLNPGASREPVSLQPPPSQVRLIAGHVLQTAVQQRAQVRQGVGGNGQVLL